MASIVEMVKGCPLFYEIYDNEIAEVIKSCYVATFDRGDYIIKQGDTSSDICIILDGTAGITIESNGVEKEIISIGKGDLFGELVLINETQRTANIVAREHTDVLVMTYENFYSFYNKNPKVFGLMVLNVTRLVTKRLKQSNKIIENLNSQIHDLDKKDAA